MHMTEYFTYSEKKSKEKIFAELNSYVSKRTENHECISKIRWMEGEKYVYPCEEDAEEAISRIDLESGLYDDCIAVKFRKVEEDRNLRAKACAAWAAYHEAENVVVAKSFKAQLVGCKKCGSRLNREYLKSNFCPLCGADMRSETELHRIQRLREKAEDAEKKIIEAKRKSKKGKVYWLVKIEWHE